MAIALYLLLANLLAWVAFGIDKRRAVADESRIPERTLLTLAFFGGWPGAKLAQHRYRHKTRKQPFRTLLNAIGLVQILLILALSAVSYGGVARLQSFAGQALAAVQPAAAAEEKPEERPLPRRFGPGSEDKRRLQVGQ